MNDVHTLTLDMIAHELKNPLTLIRSTLQLLGSRYPEVAKDPMWHQVCLDLMHMSRLLSELPMRREQEIICYEKVNVRNLFREMEAMFTMEAQCQKKEIFFRLETLQANMEGHGLMLRQLLVNLIQNALEATNAEDIIEVTAVTEGNLIVFKVCDTGCGMNPEEIDSMFEPFVTRKSTGTGLGMVIVKNIVDAHGGKIEVESQKNCGTEIKVMFPIEK